MENLSSAMFFQVNADPNTAVLVILLQCEFNMVCIKIVDHEENIHKIIKSGLFIHIIVDKVNEWLFIFSV